METLVFDLGYIKKRRKELKISMKKMAAELGFKHASTYLKYERGEYSFKAEQLPILAKVLQCKISDFYKQNVA